MVGPLWSASAENRFTHTAGNHPAWPCSLERAILAGVYIANLISRLRIHEWIEHYILRKKNHKNDTTGYHIRF